MPDRTITTSTGTTVSLTHNGEDTVVLLDHPKAPADMRPTEAGRVIDCGFQFAPDVDWSLSPEGLRAIADLIDGGTTAIAEPIGPDGDTGTRAIDTTPSFVRAGHAIAQGWTPPYARAIVEPRRITTAADLDALKRGSVILLDYDVILQAVLDWEAVEDPSCWRGVGEGAPILTSSQVIESAGKGATITVLHVPAEVSDGE